MTDRPLWLFDEEDQSGVNYMELETARKYDKRHEQFRDFESEFQRINGRIHLKSSDSVIDFGCGTGAFSIQAAPHCRKIFAVDISATMLALLNEKKAEKQLSNIETIQAGFLTYEHKSEPVDVLLSSIALHHLPDFWKMVALNRIASMLKPNGVFYLFDVIFHFPIAEWKDKMEQIADEMSRSAGNEAFVHLKQEFSTFDWIIEGMLKRTGFVIDHIYDDISFCRAYLCRKQFTE